MNLFIFGAGASYGSDEKKSLLPPLAKDLFACLSNEYWDIANNKKAMLLKPLFEEDFEKGFEALGQEDPYFLSVFQRRMADFFFKFKPTSNNLYYKLAKALSNSKAEVSFATLNYERLLELSLGQFFQPVSNLLPNENQVEICYPHGCSHLFVEGISAGNGVMYGKGVIFEGSIIGVVNEKEHKRKIQNEAISPVMSYFESSKYTPSGLNYIVRQRDRLKELVMKAEKIAIIGIRIREHDLHIWEPLSSTNAKIIYCSGGEDAEKYNIWRQEKTQRDKDILLSGYWNNEFDTINREML